MKRQHLTLVIVLSVFVHLSSAIGISAEVTIQRHRIIGATLDGSKVALLLSHFGPSSRAPFANVVVWQSGATAPVYFNSKFILQGGEEELSKVEQAVLQESESKLIQLGIKKTDQIKIVEAPTTWSQAVSEFSLIKGAFDLQNDTPSLSFEIQKVPMKGCKGVSWRLCLSNNCYSPIVPKKQEACATHDIHLRSIFRVGSSVWFVVHRKMVPFSDIESYLVDLVAMPTGSKRGRNR